MDKTSEVRGSDTFDVNQTQRMNYSDFSRVSRVLSFSWVFFFT